VRRGQRGERGGQQLVRRAGADRRVHPVGERLGDRVGAGAGQRPVLPDLGPAVAADEVGRDPVQPWPRVRACQVIAVPLPEGEQERLRHQVIGGVGAEAAHHVPLDMACVPAEQDLECLGLMPGTLDDFGIGRIGFSARPALCRHAEPFGC
jgi:hypothetical protein